MEMMMNGFIDILSMPVTGGAGMVFWWMVGLSLVLPATAFLGTK
jgi:hypothetical protein